MPNNAPTPTEEASPDPNRPAGASAPEGGGVEVAHTAAGDASVRGELLRPEDLLHLRVVASGFERKEDGRWVAAAPDRPGVITFVFPPQHALEASFKVEALHELPEAHACLALPSRVAVEVPPGESVTMTTTGLLEALARFPMRLAPAARSGVSARAEVSRPDTLEGVARRVRRERRATRAPRGGVDGEVRPPSATASAASESDLRPTKPSDDETAIEVPWRLLLSPTEDGRWALRTQSPRRPDVQDPLRRADRVELWHARLEPAAPEQRASVTARALWTRDPGFVGTATPEDNRRAVGQPVEWARNTRPNPADRVEIVHLTSDGRFNRARADVRRLILSSLGAWLDLQLLNTRTTSEINLRSWEHRATMGRDQWVRVEDRGTLWPYGVPASLVSLARRDLSASAPGVAYLEQETFVVPDASPRVYAEVAGGRALRGCAIVSASVRGGATPPLQVERSENYLAAKQPVRLHQNGAPYRFRIAAVDQDGTLVEFNAPCVWVPWSFTDEDEVRRLYEQYANHRRIELRGRRFAFAPAGPDPSEGTGARFEVTSLEFDGAIGSDQGPIPRLARAEVAVEALRALVGDGRPVAVTYDSAYLDYGMPEDGARKNPAALVLKLVEGVATSFSTATDRVGAFVAPEMNVTALSRSLGLVSRHGESLRDGAFDPAAFFPESAKLFGVFALKDLIAGKALANAPRFVTQALDVVEATLDEARRWQGFLDGRWEQLAATFREIEGRAARDAKRVAHALGSLTFSKAAEGLIALVWRDLHPALVAFVHQAAPDLDVPVPEAFTADAWGRFLGALAERARGALNVVLVELEGRLRDRVAALLADAEDAVRRRLEPLVGLALLLWRTWQSSVALASAVRGLASLAEASLAEASLDAAIRGACELAAVLADAVGDALLAAAGDAFAQVTGGAALVRAELESRAGRLRESAQALAAAASALRAYADAVELARNLTVRYEWSTPLAGWPADRQASHQIFVPHRLNGAHEVASPAALLRLRGELRGKQVGDRPAGFDVEASIDAFTLQLVAPHTVIALAFDRIAFRARSGRKPEVDVCFRGIEFEGPLAFVETLRRVIPLDGFSDPPAVEVSPAGISADYSMALPNLAVGVFSLQNLSLSAGFAIPFIGDALSFRFAFCSRSRPFTLTVAMLGGGGFFGIALTPKEVTTLEAALEFGASLSVDFGVASGSVSIMAGIYFKLERGAATISGYLRMRGEVDVLGLISASLELYMSLTYEGGEVVGRASLEIEVEVLFFSVSVTLLVEKRFAGARDPQRSLRLDGGAPGAGEERSARAGGAPTFLEAMAPTPAAGSYPWRDYFLAFDPLS